MDVESDSETSEDSRYDGVFSAIEKVRKHEYPSESGHWGSPYPHLTNDQLDEKLDVVKTLCTSLLPAIKRQLTAFLNSLDLSEHSDNPCPNVESTVSILSEMSDTVGETISAAETLVWEPPLPEPRHDRHLKELKHFRYTRILRITRAVIHGNLLNLLPDFSLLMIFWDRQENLNDITSQLKSANLISTVSWRAANIRNLIDAVVRQSTLSDLAILQETWQDTRQNTHKMLKTLSKVINGTYLDSSGRVNWNEQDGITKQEVKGLHRACSIQLAQSVIPVVKLARLFYGKLCNIAIHPIPFTLDRELSSAEYNMLLKTMDAFHATIHHLVAEIYLIDESDQNIVPQIRSLRQITLHPMSTLEQALLALAFHIAPSHADDTDRRRAALQRDFKACFFSAERYARRCLLESPQSR
ncbi:hypothetical protein PCASD_10636 [Puccinia coronata f. sp. avenae]|uniref:Uncharacterized protein n=1 Tax=Puccinia coronata f. sp. avenae TaxID=200324 RepID=A0A2N5TEA5_9BASI|nr:hypothetical protein PCASD_10636 [Puccinia coronata f. sp. avenae]